MNRRTLFTGLFAAVRAAVVVLTAAFTLAHAETPPLKSMNDEQLHTRWNKQADWNDKAFVLRNCASRKVPNSNRSFQLCETAGKGIIAFRRQAGSLENVEYQLKGHPLNDATMFVSFVRGTNTGDMPAVGVALLRKAQQSGTACTTEPSAQICAHYASGEFVMEAR